MNIKNWKEFLKDVPTEILLSEIENRKNKNTISDLASFIIDKLDYAIKQFGSYTFEDKGPDEVIDIPSIKNKLSNKPIKEIAKILSEVLDNYPNYGHASSLVNYIIGEFDNLSDEDFEELLDSDDRFEY
jgi:hypothetical protein